MWAKNVIPLQSLPLHNNLESDKSKWLHVDNFKLILLYEKKTLSLIVIYITHIIMVITVMVLTFFGPNTEK